MLNVFKTDLEVWLCLSLRHLSPCLDLVDEIITDQHLVVQQSLKNLQHIRLT